jgi:hypothetical protein
MDSIISLLWPLGLFFALVLWVWALLDVVKISFSSPFLRTLFVMLILLFPLIGSIFYFQMKKRVSVDSREFRPQFNH